MSLILGAAALDFVRERHLATYTCLLDGGRPHVTPVGFTWDGAAGLARVITSGTSRKARAARDGRTVVLCQVDGARWLALEGTPTVLYGAEAVRLAEQRYAERYRQPRPNPQRVVIEVAVHRVYGSARLTGG